MTQFTLARRGHHACRPTMRMSHTISKHLQTERSGRRLRVPVPTCWLLAAFLVACGSQERASSNGDDRKPAGEALRPAATALGSGYVYTADEAGRSITRVDLRSGVATTIAVGVMPHNVQISPDGRSVLAVGSALMNMTGNREDQHGNDAGEPGMLLVVRSDASDTSGALRIPIGHSPAHVVVAADGRRAFTTNSGDNAVIVVDLIARRATDTIRTAAFPHGLRLSPDGRELYVACVDANSVSVIDVATLREVARIPVGRAPVQVGFTPDGRRAYVTLRDANAVAVIGTRARRVTARIPVGRAPIQLVATPDGRLVYVANQGTSARPDSTVSVIDTDRNMVVATVLAGRGAHGVAVSTDGSRVFVANTFANTVTVIDVAKKRALASVTVGKGPGGITYRP